VTPDEDPGWVAGEWRIDRELTDRAVGERGSFTGALVVTSDAAGYRWQESGTLRWAGRSLAAARTLGINRRDGQWWMTFGDGRLFHQWMVGSPVRHPCAADTYHGLITRTSDDQFTTTWEVTGPEKDQLIVSRLTRIS
jgi:hypothetical protein